MFIPEAYVGFLYPKRSYAGGARVASNRGTASGKGEKTSKEFAISIVDGWMPEELFTVADVCCCATQKEQSSCEAPSS